MENKTKLEKLNDALKIVAYAILHNKSESVSESSLERESARIERCIELHYKLSDESIIHYLDFASKFLQNNHKELVFGSKFSGNYLDDVKNPKHNPYDLEESELEYDDDDQIRIINVALLDEDI